VSEQSWPEFQQGVTPYQIQTIYDVSPAFLGDLSAWFSVNPLPADAVQQSVTGPSTGAVTVTSFTPTSGSAGTSVTITGTGFTGATSVTFNGVAATSYTVGSDTSITATAPTGVTSGPISVTSPSGTATSSTSFTVASSNQVLSYDTNTSPVTVTSTSEGSPNGLVTASHAVTSDGSTTQFLVEFWALGALAASSGSNVTTLAIASYRNGVSMGRTVGWTDYSGYDPASGLITQGTSAPLYGRRVSIPPAGSVTFSAGAWLPSSSPSPMIVQAGSGGSGNIAPMSLMVTQIYPP